MPETYEVKSPEWWVNRLYKRLNDRRPQVQMASAYRDGVHNLAYATDKFREAFGGLFREFANNFCGIVVQAKAERMKVQGIALSLAGDDSPTYDKEAWAHWQRNGLDSWAAAHQDATLTTGYGYMLVWVDADDEPLITVEDPENVIVEYEPGSLRKRAAALKCWVDDWTGLEMANLYLPEAIHKFKSAAKVRNGSRTRTWVRLEEDADGEPLPLDNPLGVVPIVEFLNDPNIKGVGRSEIRSIIPLQNAINKVTTDMMVASEFGAYRGMAISGWTPDVDPETGQPDPRQTRRAIERFLTFANPETKVQTFPDTNLKNYVDEGEWLIYCMAVQTSTPRHYLVQQGQSPSGDAIKSSETGLVAKVRERMLFMDDPYEEVFRLAFKVKGENDKAKATNAEIRWADPEYRSEGERTDAVIKKLSGGIITWEQACEDLGYSPQQIDRMQKQLTRDVLMRQGANLATLLDRGTEEPAA